jgi:DNA-binding transcriptional regulator YdaS (Cro superfamily)
MAWKGQRLPFDVGNQRVIMEDRDLIDLDSNRKKLVSFIHAAKEGRFYRPMDAVSRLATIQAASESLAEDSLLRALAQEVKALRITMTTAVQPRGFHRIVDPGASRTVKRLIRGKVFRQELFPYFVSIGGKPHEWNRLLKMQMPAETVGECKSWGADEWKTFISTRLPELTSAEPASQDAQAISEDVQPRERVEPDLDLQLLERVKEALPEQPWPDGIHKKIAETLGITKSQVSKYMKELIKRGDFSHQVDGTLLTSEDVG